MKRERVLIEALVAGSLSQEQWNELASLIGTDMISRIQRGDAKLHEILTEMSIADVEFNASKMLEKYSAVFPKRTSLSKFLQRWGLLCGIAFFTSMAVIVFPLFTTSVGGEFTLMQGAQAISPFQLGLGTVLLICFGVAVWLDWSDKL